MRGVHRNPTPGPADGEWLYGQNWVAPAVLTQHSLWGVTANILNKMPRSVPPKAKKDLHEIWMAETGDQAHRAFDPFLEKYQVKYEAACECLKKDRGELLAFYDFPAEHWKHLKTTNPIESAFATTRHRHRKRKGSGFQNRPAWR